MIHLIVGNTGAGKTTYAQRLKEEIGGVVFSIDQWNKTLFFPDKKETDGLDWFLERIDRVENMIGSLVLQLESSDTDSILDLGLSKYAHRQKFRDFAMEHGFTIKIHFLDVTKEERLKRVMNRNKEKGETFEFEVTRENFDFMETWFERLLDEEMDGGLIVRE